MKREYQHLIFEIIEKYAPIPLTSSEIFQEAIEMGYDDRKTRFAFNELINKRLLLKGWVMGKKIISFNDGVRLP